MTAVRRQRPCPGDPGLVMEAMKCFRQYTMSTPAYTRDFADAVTKVNAAVELFPSAERDD